MDTPPPPGTPPGLPGKPKLPPHREKPSDAPGQYPHETPTQYPGKKPEFPPGEKPPPPPGRIPQFSEDLPPSPHAA